MTDEDRDEARVTTRPSTAWLSALRATRPGVLGKVPADHNLVEQGSTYGAIDAAIQFVEDSYGTAVAWPLHDLLSTFGAVSVRCGWTTTAGSRFVEWSPAHAVMMAIATSIRRWCGVAGHADRETDNVYPVGLNGTVLLRRLHVNCAPLILVVELSTAREVWHRETTFSPEQAVYALLRIALDESTTNHRWECASGMAPPVAQTACDCDHWMRNSLRFRTDLPCLDIAFREAVLIGSSESDL